jgi:hypothetical protein
LRFVVAVVLLGTACGSAATQLPCLPEGEHDFFLVRDDDFSAVRGTLNFQSELGGPLSLGDGTERMCWLTSMSDDRDKPISSCQVGWRCVEAGCTDCSVNFWFLFLAYRPNADGVMPQGSANLPDDKHGVWSAARRNP